MNLLLSVRRDDGQDVGLAQDQQVILVELEFRARILGEQDAFALFDIRQDALASIENAAGANCQHFPLLGLFFGGIGQDDAALGDLLAFEWLDYHPVAEGAQVETRHAMSSPSWTRDSVSTRTVGVLSSPRIASLV